MADPGNVRVGASCHRPFVTESASPRFVVEGTESSWRITIEHARDAHDRVGASLFCGFLKCFMGVERLTSFVDLLLLTQQSLAEDTLRRRRNTRLVAVLMQSALVEIAEALDELNAAKVVLAMNTPALWAPLERKRKAWLNDKRLRQVRNGIGHHLGGASDFRVGMAALLETSDSLVFAVGEGRRRIDGEHQLAWNALLRGLGHGQKNGREMEPADHEHVAKVSMEALNELEAQLWPVWLDVLARAGVHYER